MGETAFLKMGTEWTKCDLYFRGKDNNHISVYCVIEGGKKPKHD